LFCRDIFRYLLLLLLLFLLLFKLLHVILNRKMTLALLALLATPAVYVSVFVVGFHWVTTCQLSKMTCARCNLGPPSSCGSSGFFSSTRENCYNNLDGNTKVLAEYKADTSQCYYGYCFYTAVSYINSLTNIMMMMACPTGLCSVLRA